MRTGLVGLVVALSIVACAGHYDDAPAIDVLIIGDSLLHESQQVLEDGLSRSRVLIRANPGYAPCDFLRTLDDDLARRPRLVVLETAGINVTQCIPGSGVLGSKRHARRYSADVAEIIGKARAAGARVLVVDPPPVGGLSAAFNDGLTRMDLGWRSDAKGKAGVRFTSLPRDAVSDHGSYTATLPCRPDERQRTECRAGTIAVRDPYFGVHFCPKTYADPVAVRRGCRSYSSGAVRFGEAMVVAIRTTDRQTDHDATR